jgi:hypothetical protein
MLASTDPEDPDTMPDPTAPCIVVQHCTSCGSALLCGAGYHASDCDLLGQPGIRRVPAGWALRRDGSWSPTDPK